MDLKFFYLVELNLKHPEIQKLPISQQFSGQSWLTLQSNAYINDKECVDACKAFMEEKVKQFNKPVRQVQLTYAENPHLHVAQEDLDSVDAEGFDENALVSMAITDWKDQWLIQAAVMVFGLTEDAQNYRSLH